MIIGTPGGFDTRSFESTLLTVTAILVVWFVLIGLTGWLAGRRNWDDGLWALLALLTGPIALLIVLLAPKRLSPPSTHTGATYREAAAAPDWPVFPEREARITRSQRRFSTAVAGLVGGSAARIVAGDLQPIPVMLTFVVAGTIATAMVGRWRAPTLVGATVVRTVWTVVVTAVVAMSISAFLTVAVTGVPVSVAGAHGPAEYSAYLGAAILYPVVSALIYPPPLLISIVAAAVWALATSLLVRQASASSPPRMSAHVSSSSLVKPPA